jgi:predicted dehydrogenase
MAGPLRTAVVGVGHFGQHHAGKLANAAESRLVAIVDRDLARAKSIGDKYGAEALSDYRELFGRVDAVSIATPPASHESRAKDFIEPGVHVLVEKPITETLDDAERLIRLAETHRRILQVGHIERFSAVGRRLAEFVKRPLFIQAQRIGPFKPRGEAVSAVLDLMIHDLDLILSLVGAPIEWVHAIGAPVLTGADDIANCRVQFTNGTVADLTASRVSLKLERKMRIFQQDSCTSVDFVKRRISVFRRGPRADGAASEITVDETVYAQVDALEEEIGAFLAAAGGSGPTIVTGEDGRRALEAALMIDKQLRAHWGRVAAPGTS